LLLHLCSLRLKFAGMLQLHVCQLPFQVAYFGLQRNMIVLHAISHIIKEEKRKLKVTPMAKRRKPETLAHIESPVVYHPSPLQLENFDEERPVLFPMLVCLYSILYSVKVSCVYHHTCLTCPQRVKDAFARRPYDSTAHPQTI
jgi:hypothetical protein